MNFSHGGGGEVLEVNGYVSAWLKTLAVKL